MHFISEFIDLAVRDVFHTMFNVEAVPVRRAAGADIPSIELSGVVGSVSFAGGITGTLYMAYSNGLACGITERLLGERPARSSDPEVLDVIGEIANMTSGDVTRRTSAKGFGGYLSPPVVMAGTEILAEPKGAPIALFNLFKMTELDEELSVRVFAKLEN